jgi:hypothetical protein
MLHYLVGDPTQPQVQGNQIVAHIGDDGGRWQSCNVPRNWPLVRKAWRAWQEEPGFALGETQFVPITPDFCIASMVAGHAGDRPCPGGRFPLRLPALRKCLRAVAEEAFRMQASVHLARLPEWPAIEAILLEELAPQLEVYVYDEPPPEA